MDDHKFFKFLWRVNALIIFGVSFAAAVGLLILTWFLVEERRSYDGPLPPSAELSAQATPDREKIRLRVPYNRRTVDEYTYIEARISKYSSGGLSKGGGSGQIRNIAVFNFVENTANWIFPNNQQEIESYLSVKKNVRGEDGDISKITTGFLLTVARTFSDGEVSRNLWVMAPSGEGLTEVMANIYGKARLEYFGENEVRLLLETDEGVNIHPVDVDTLNIGAPTELNLP